MLPGARIGVWTFWNGRLRAVGLRCGILSVGEAVQTFIDVTRGGVWSHSWKGGGKGGREGRRGGGEEGRRGGGKRGRESEQGLYIVHIVHIST